jgi:pimeloyl-ACP methyl ester carboxylesterase
MATIDLPHGTLHYRQAGPDRSDQPPVVFVHGFLVNGSLWSRVAEELSRRGIRSFAPDWPLGSHREAMHDDADQSPRGVARLVLSFIEALGLDDVTLVGNDSGGAICQFVLDTDASRIGRVVLTNCDGFELFPPAPFDKMFKLARRPGLLRMGLAPTRLRRIRHSALGFKPLVAKPLDAEQTRDWVDPCLRDRGVRRDAARFCQAVDPSELEGVSGRLGAFEGPALLVWGSADPYFTIDLGRRLRAAFADARLVEVPGGRTFLPLDEPAKVAAEIASFVTV